MKAFSAVALCSCLFLFTACPDQGVVCAAGTERCGQGCIDPSADAKNCGTCGSSCRSGQVCAKGACVCNTGTVSCNGECVVLETDPKHCGVCGPVPVGQCGVNEICENSTCKLSCPLTGASATCTVDGGAACVNTQTDPNNCGGCGTVCGKTPDGGPTFCGVSDAGTGQCLATCDAPNTRCGGSCVDLKSDHDNCNACGAACLAIEACTNGVCTTNCPGTTPTRCGNACVNTANNAQHCGACGVVCENAQSCHMGRCTYDLVAACFSSGQVVGLEAKSEFRGPLEALGTAPQSLAALGGNLLSADGIDQKVYQAKLLSVGGHAFAQVGRPVNTANAPNHILAEPPYVFVANSGSGTVQVLQNFGAVFPDGGAPSDGGLALLTVGELALGANTYPEAIAKLGDTLWVPLYGGFGAGPADAGQRIAKVDLTYPTAPANAGSVSLQGLDLKAFDGGNPVARPYAIVAHNGFLYVALNNLNPDTYVPEGPGLVVKIDPVASTVSKVIDLGGTTCLNPGWIGEAGNKLVVSCIGAAEYAGPPSFQLLRTVKSGVRLIDENDVPVAMWSPACPNAADGGPGCTPILPSRFAVNGNRIYLGDQNGGRIFVLDINGNTLGERRGYYGDAGMPISACTPDLTTGIANVADVLAVP